MQYLIAYTEYLTTGKYCAGLAKMIQKRFD